MTAPSSRQTEYLAVFSCVLNARDELLAVHGTPPAETDTPPAPGLPVGEALPFLVPILPSLREGGSELLEPGYLVQGVPFSVAGESCLTVVVRRISAADRLLAPYGPSDVNEGLVEQLLNNRLEGIIAANAEGCITYLCPHNERFFGQPNGSALGHPVNELVPGNSLVRVAQTGKSETVSIQLIGGRHKIVTNLPIRKHGKVVGAFGRIAFQDVSQVMRLAETVKTLESRVERYQGMIDQLQQERDTRHHIVGESAVMRRLLSMAEDVAASNMSVVISGESGTGKELFAQAIHTMSPRQAHPFVAVNCAALPHDLAESELFGYVEGAFTGARRAGKPGRFELANNGTLFLDEIGDLPLATQAKLLRVLQERTLERVGDVRVRPVSFRLICASNADLKGMVDRGLFRLDLYHRINEFHLHIPPLRERVEDIPPLVRSLMRRINAVEETGVTGISDECVRFLMAQPWNGNVRELRNTLRQTMWLARGRTLVPADLMRANLRRNGHDSSASMSLTECVRDAERRAINVAMQAYNGNKSLVAKALGIHRTSLYKKMHQLDITP